MAMRGNQIQMTKDELRKLKRELKDLALGGDVQAALALSNFQIVELAQRKKGLVAAVHQPVHEIDN